jgi:hypothetical protein
MNAPAAFVLKWLTVLQVKGQKQRRQTDQDKLMQDTQQFANEQRDE